MRLSPLTISIDTIVPIFVEIFHSFWGALFVFGLFLTIPRSSVTHCVLNECFAVNYKSYVRIIAKGVFCLT